MAGVIRAEGDTSPNSKRHVFSTVVVEKQGVYRFPKAGIIWKSKEMVKKAKVDTKSYDCYLWDAPEIDRSEDRLNRLASSICRMYRFTRSTHCMASFYPYVGLKSTIRIEHGNTILRISDILADAPDAVLDALIHILLARASHKKPLMEYLTLYRDYISQPEVEARHAALRSKRTRKKIMGTKGKYHDLDDSFQRVNTGYFRGAFPKPMLSWSPGSSRRLLGYHDSHLNLVVISRWLDRKTVPLYVLDYIMYHELLHIIISSEYKNGKRIVHTKEFKRREMEFEEYANAIRWLRR
ncbi:MAG: M48 family peptidase [Candidatus Omnitrophota bacterium]|jgi:hypothetical protein|nr:MAG: M48 family peptidase [Candidatus Omnitrophota bacterium]